MIRTIIVDDEQPALLKLKNLLLPYTEFQVVGDYTDAHEALEQLDVTQPQVAFLDIAMPAFNGIDLATAIQHKLSHPVQIVFISAYDEYALTAFEVNATDYLLKPVSRSRFRQTVERLNEGISARRSRETPPAVLSGAGQTMVRMFGKLEIVRDGKPFGSWRTAKVRELFAFFLHNRTQSIYRETILETLWGHMSAERALASMNTCNYYLRRQLEESGSGIKLEYTSNYYTIDLNGATCDCDLFESASSALPITAQNLSFIQESVALYRGLFLEDVKCAWAQIDRERYASNYTALRADLAQFFLTQGDFIEAENNALRALEINPLQTSACKALLCARRAKGDQHGFGQARDKILKAFSDYPTTPIPDDLKNELGQYRTNEVV